MLNQYAVEIPTLPVNLCLSHLIQTLVECLAVLWECRAAEKGRQAFGAQHGFSGNVFCKSNGVFFSTLSEGIESMELQFSDHIHSSHAVKSENQTPVQDQRCQPGPSAKKSVIPSKRGFSKNYGADQQRLQISDLHFNKFLTPATFACWKIRFKTEVCTLFTISDGSYAVDERSGVGRFSG